MERPLGLWALVSFNAAIVLWLVLNLLPVGIAQLAATVENGFGYARSLAFYDTVTFWQWARLPGDLAYLAGALLLIIDLYHKFWLGRRAWVARRHRAPGSVHAAPLHPS